MALGQSLAKDWENFRNPGRPGARGEKRASTANHQAVPGSDTLLRRRGEQGQRLALTPEIKDDDGGRGFSHLEGASSGLRAA
jgi:hypothetical protein